MKIYTKRAVNAAQYARMRGVTDFSNAAQFNLYETGYSYLCVITKPAYLEMLAQQLGDSNEVKGLLDAFCYILEFEFRGLSGIDDVTTDPLEVTDGISTLNVLGKVTKQSAAEISMTFTEKSGSVITNFLNYYISGIKDPRTQAKTYHGLIKYGLMAAGFENEVFNLLYIVTDSTMLQIEKSYLLCNAWPSKAQTSIYNTEKGSIEKQDIELSWNCFVIDGPEVDRQALRVLAYINEKGAVEGALSTTGANGLVALPKNNISEESVVHLESDGGDDFQQKGIQGFVYTAAKNGSDLANYVGNDAGTIE